MYSEKIKQMAADVYGVSRRDAIIHSLDGFCTKDDLNRVKVCDVYALYVDYCKDNGLKIPSPQEFGYAVSVRFGVKKKNVRFGAVTNKVFFAE